MSSREAFRLAGLALMVGAVLAFVGNLVTTFLFTGNDPTPYAGNPLFVPINILSALGTALLLLGLPVLYLSRPEGWGVLGLIGFVLVFATGLMFGIFFSLMSVLLLPYLVQHAPDTVKGNGPPAFFPFFIAGTVFEVVGLVLLAIPIVRGVIRREVEPRLLQREAVDGGGALEHADPLGHDLLADAVAGDHRDAHSG